MLRSLAYAHDDVEVGEITFKNGTTRMTDGRWMV
jgi:hypothetical protein